MKIRNCSKCKNKFPAKDMIIQKDNNYICHDCVIEAAENGLQKIDDAENLLFDDSLTDDEKIEKLKQLFPESK